MERIPAAIGGLTGPARPGRGRSTILLATASLLALAGQMPGAEALDCADAPPTDIATPAALYETLRDRTDAQLLAIGFRQRPAAAECAWIYEVKMLTASGSVVELDFGARDLDLIGARGPDNDRDVANLVRGLGGDASTIISAGAGGEGGGDGDDKREGDDKDGDDRDGDDRGGDNSGSGSDNSGEGGEGGNSGSGGGDSGGGEGGNSGSGSGGGGEGGEGGDD